ncbi:hypothetical protein HNQ91_002178 [Filimonas zeae]|uniref:Outer membrane protein beta-barrel domain-containing protein n=1 Tax=Filimonas zeae TaxID=1737353 RepID=A0A917IXN9_9BACT|nr:porin family protein [Filimonas zeae]MDR6339127.1 hypothetical protein [Filimonas zeae]GGH64986.1 hypothetical protein GCM10011379_17640 [Filimonas zeae]
MKKSLLLVAAFACTGLFSFAQTTSSKSQPLSFGLKAGVNLATITGNNGAGDGKSSLVGLNGGAFATFHVSESFGIQPELTWSTLGVKYKGTFLGSNFTSKQLLNYLTLPVLAKYTFAGSGFSLYAGPQIGYLLSAKLKTSNEDGSGSISNKDAFKSTDFGAVAGVEFEIPNTPLNVSGRYQFGLTKIGDNTGAGDNKNAAATFTVGYRLF